MQALAMANQGITHFNNALDEMVSDFPESRFALQRLLSGLQAVIHEESIGEVKHTYMPGDAVSELRQGREALFVNLYRAYTRLDKWTALMKQTENTQSQLTCLETIGELQANLDQSSLLTSPNRTNYLPKPGLRKMIEDETIQRGYPLTDQSKSINRRVQGNLYQASTRTKIDRGEIG